jgi:hypothetical protein
VAKKIRGGKAVKKKPVAKKKPRKRASHYCLICSVSVPEDDFCYGCGAFICTACDGNPQVGFSHTAFDHRP